MFEDQRSKRVPFVAHCVLNQAAQTLEQIPNMFKSPKIWAVFSRLGT